MLRRSVVVGSWVAATALVAQACGGEATKNPPPSSSVGNVAGDAGNATSRDTGGTAGKSSGIPGHGPAGAGGAAATGGAGQVAGAGGRSVVAATAGATGQESSGAGGQGIAGASGAGTSADAGTGGESATAGAGGEASGVSSEIALTPVDGWIDGTSNVLGIQGAVFSFADAASGTGLIGNFTGSNACIHGTAAKVDVLCTPVAPATDCYAMFWGAAIGLNLNQPIDPDSGLGGPPMPYDASALRGFAFELSGSKVPSSLRFKVEDAGGEYCTPPAKPMKLGDNVVLFSDLIAQCWKAGGASAVGAKSGLIKLSWQVVTNIQTTIPFDYCVGNVRALE